MNLKKSKFGKGNDWVPEFLHSTSNFSRNASNEESLAILDASRDAGGNFIQTSGICLGANLDDGFHGMSEEWLGRWLKLRRGEREEFVIATRVSLTRPLIGGIAVHAELIRQCAADSIRRIGCDHLHFLLVERTDAVSGREAAPTFTGPGHPVVGARASASHLGFQLPASFHTPSLN